MVTVRVLVKLPRVVLLGGADNSCVLLRRRQPKRPRMGRWLRARANPHSHPA